MISSNFMYTYVRPSREGTTRRGWRQVFLFLSLSLALIKNEKKKNRKRRTYFSYLCILYKRAGRKRGNSWCKKYRHDLGAKERLVNVHPRGKTNGFAAKVKWRPATSQQHSHRSRPMFINDPEVLKARNNCFWFVFFSYFFFYIFVQQLWIVLNPFVEIPAYSSRIVFVNNFTRLIHDDSQNAPCFKITDFESWLNIKKWSLKIDRPIVHGKTIVVKMLVFRCPQVVWQFQTSIRF